MRANKRTCNGHARYEPAHIYVDRTPPRRRTRIGRMLLSVPLAGAITVGIIMIIVWAMLLGACW